MAAAMVEGLGGGNIILSPRGAGVAADLAGRFPGVTVADSNQAVVDQSELVVLSIRPQIVADVVQALRFRPDQKILSLVAATQIDTLRRWIGVDVPVVRAIPLPFVASRLSVTPIYPADAQVADLFNRLGTVVECQSQKEFDLLAVGSALMGSYFGILETAQAWLAQQGLPEPAARAYLAGLFANLGTVAEASPLPFADLRGEYSTRGGLNEQMFRVFSDQGGTPALRTALEEVMKRVQG